MPDQQGVETKGGTMRLGKYPCVITPGTKMADVLRHDGDRRAPPPPL